jgi:hypothetical protein
MTSLTEIVAAVVVHSSAAALSHFGVAVEPTPVEKAQPAPQVQQRVIARTPRKSDKVSLNAAPAQPRSAGA